MLNLVKILHTLHLCMLSLLVLGTESEKSPQLEIFSGSLLPGSGIFTTSGEDEGRTFVLEEGRPLNVENRSFDLEGGRSFDVEEADDSLYSVQKRGAGEVSDESKDTDGHKDRFRCKVQSPPVFRFDESRRQKLAAAGLGTSVTLVCHYRKGCPPPSVTWLKEGRQVEERESVVGRSNLWIRHRHNKGKGKAIKLYISDLREDDSGLYTCVISNQWGSISHNITVRAERRMVASKPEIQANMPGDHTVVAGSSLALECRLTVTDAALATSVRWHHHYQVDGRWKNETGHYYTKVVQDSDHFPTDDYKLELHNVSVADTGYYSCHFKNLYGEDVSTGLVKVLDHIDDVSLSMKKQLEAAGESVSRTVIISILVCGSVGLFLTALVLWYWLKYRKERRNKRLAVESAQNVIRWTKKVIVERSEDKPELVFPQVRIITVEEECTFPNSTEYYTFDVDNLWELPRELLHLKEELGQGAFGRVVRAQAHNCALRHPEDGGSGLVLSQTDQPLVVAVKMLKETHTEAEMLDLVKEMEIMKAVGGHMNIVNLLGVCTQPPGQPLLAVLEYAEFGNLRQYMQDRRRRDREQEQVSFRKMLSFATQVARGMEFLSGKHCVHRDLAARNVLVAKGDIVKIADFGLARDMEDSDYYRKVGEAKLPVLWMSPESLFEGMSSTQSDVWSFGVLLWEIVTWGERPYPGLNPGTVLELIQEGYRMSRPLHCPPDLYLVMLNCWELQADRRPVWATLVSCLQKLHHDTLPGFYLDLVSLEVNTPSSSLESSVDSVFFLPNTVEAHSSSPLLYTTLSPTNRRVSEESGYRSRNEDGEMISLYS